MGMLDRVRGNGKPNREDELREMLRVESSNAQLLVENLARLEQSMAEEGWRKTGTLLEREFTRDGLDNLVSMSRAMYMSNPLIQRAVNVTTFYTWAQGVRFEAKDDKVQEVIDSMTEDDGNRAELYGHQAMILTDVDQMVDGNVFLSLFTSDQGDVFPRSVPTEEIRDIILDPDDHTKVQFYHRVWNQAELNKGTGEINYVQQEAYYPDWRYDGGSGKPDNINNKPVKWNAPIIHQRTGGLKRMRFGVPETYAAIDWARAYKKFLEDWHTIVSSLARFAWKMTASKKRQADAKKKLGGSGTRAELLEEGNEQDQRGAGAVYIGNEEMTPIPKTGATTSADDAKASRLMVASAMNLPDTILSNDPQQGALATAKTLDRPSELGFLSRQAMWGDLHENIFKYAVSAKQGVARVGDTADTQVTVSFPPILEHDVTETVGALVSAATLDGKAEAGTIPRELLSRHLMEAIGVSDVEEAMGELQKQIEDMPPEVQQATDALMEAAKRLR